MIAAPLVDKRNKPVGVIQVLNKMREELYFSKADQKVVTGVLHHITGYTECLSGR